MDVRSEDYGELQRLVDSLFAPGVSSSATVERLDSSAATCTKLDVVARAGIFDLCDDLAEVVEALPSRTYTRQRLCDQLNSIVVGHGWGAVYGTVE